MSLKPKNYVLAPYHFRAAEACAAARCYVPLEKERPSHAAWWGIGTHLFLNYAQTRGRDYALAYMRRKFPRMVKFVQKINVDALPDGEVEAHVIIDTENRTAMEADSQRDADVENHVYARADLWAPERKVPLVADYKTGERPYEPLENPQMMILSSALWLYSGKPEYVESVVINVVKDGSTPWTIRRVDGEMAEAFLERLRHVHLLVLETRSEREEEGIDPPFEPGPHCESCHARSACPHAKVKK